MAYRYSTSERYLVNGNIKKVPHDFCPECWREWGFKLKNHCCLKYGIEMGKDVKILLDTDNCPNCEEGNVTLNKPKCDEAGWGGVVAANRESFYHP